MPPHLRRIMLASLLVFVVSTTALVTMPLWRPAGMGGDNLMPRGPLSPDQGLEELRIPDFDARDEAGRAFTRRIFDGRVTITDFFFTSCQMACPAMTMEMSKLSRSLAGTSVRFASLSIDPEHDTPERLAEYAKQFDADLTRWTFGTAGEGVFGRILRENLKERLERDPDTANRVKTKDGQEMDNIIHPVVLWLVGPAGEILGRFNSKDPEAMAALEARARAAAAKLGAR